MPTFPPIRGLSPLGFGGDIGASQLYFVHTRIDLRASNALDLTVPSLCNAKL